MRFVRVGQAGREAPALLADDGTLWDLAPLTPDIDGAFLQGGTGPVADALATGVLRQIHDEPERWGAPIARPGKIVGIGLNYRQHAAETGAEPPGEPVVFLKAVTSLCGPRDAVHPLPGATKTDWEVELGVVLGQRLKDESDPGRALMAVAGYVAANDVTDRELQLERGGTWTKGKSADTFCPVGPWLVTPDCAGDPQCLRLQLWVNGVPRQDGCTDDMLFSVGELLCYVSAVMTLEPGDLVLTGTPAGVAMGQPEPRPFLRHGDRIELEVQGLGRQRTEVVARVEVA